MDAKAKARAPVPARIPRVEHLQVANHDDESWRKPGRKEVRSMVQIECWEINDELDVVTEAHNHAVITLPACLPAYFESRRRDGNRNLANGHTHGT